MIRLVFITLAILSGVQGTTYSMCNGACSVTFPMTCGTVLYVDGNEWSCSIFKLPGTYPASLSSCPGDIVINQTDNSVVCLYRRCPGNMVALTSGWVCQDSSCPYQLIRAPSSSSFDYICQIPNCKGSSVKLASGSWACDLTAYDQGEEDYLSGHIAVIIIVTLLLMMIEAVVIWALLQQSFRRKAQIQAKLGIQLNTTIPGTPQTLQRSANIL